MASPSRHSFPPHGPSQGHTAAHRAQRAASSDPKAAPVRLDGSAGNGAPSPQLDAAGLQSGAALGGGSLASVATLAGAIGVELVELLALADAAPGLYTPRPVSKPGGGVRLTFEPAEPLKAVQRVLGSLIRSATPPSPIAYGDPIAAVRPHCGRLWVLAGDVKNCHPSITAEEITRTLAGVDPEVVELVVKLSTNKGRLVQGAPIAPALAECVLGGVDLEVAERAPLAVSASRYADDVILSGGHRDAVAKAGAAWADAAAKRGLRIRLGKPTPRSRPQAALGLTLNQRSGPAIPKDKRKAIRDRVRGIVNRAQFKGGMTPTDRRRVAGLIGWVRRLHPTEATALDRMVGLLLNEGA